MNYWIITDTHFGYHKMQDYCLPAENTSLNPVRDAKNNKRYAMSIENEKLQDVLYWKRQARVLLNGLRTIITQVSSEASLEEINKTAFDTLKKAQSVEYIEFN